MLKYLNVLAYTSLLSLFILSACTTKTEKIIIEKQAPPNMLESFSQPLSMVCQRASCITLQKKSLNKIFLLMVSGKTSGATPQWYDVKPLVVSFDRSGPKVALLGQNYNSIYEEVKTENFIASFDIIAEDADSLTFDWGRGLETLIVQSPYQIDSAASDNSLTESSFGSLPITGSYVRHIKFDENNIELEQISRLRVDKINKSGSSISLEGREENISLNIQIRAYNLGAQFKKKTADKSRRVGFFVTKVTKPGLSTEVVNLVTKWDIDPARGPIIVRVSSSVGADYLDAVKEGILYWNHVFGREVLSVQTGVSEQDAVPQDRSIMLRWVDWMDAGAAYAMGQSDPLTGEVLRAQVFLPAVFTKVGSAELVRLNHGSPVVGDVVTCDFSDALKELAKLSREASDSQRLRLAQDSIRATVAHELGHALGLRHNFAGSYSTKVSTADLYKAAETYLSNPQHPGLETSTSIMDYVSGIDNILMAAKIKTSALSYDKMAMDWAYADNDAPLDKNISDYCSDEDISLAYSQKMAVYDCERFDAGNNPLLRKYLYVKEGKEDLVRVLFVSILGRLYPGDSKEVANIDQVLADTRKWGHVNFNELTYIREALMDISVDGSPKASFSSLDALKSGQIMTSKFGYDPVFKKDRDKNLKEAGGYARLVNDFLRNNQGELDLNWYDRQVEDLVSSGVLEKGKTLSGREYKLSKTDQKKIVSFFESLSASNKKTLIKEVTKMLPALNEAVKTAAGISKLTASLPANMISQTEADSLAELALESFMASQAEQVLHVGKGLQQEVRVGERFFTSEERLSLMPLLSSQLMKINQEANRLQARAAIGAAINQVLKAIDPAADIAALSFAERKALVKGLTEQGLIDQKAGQWLTAELKIYEALN